MIIVEIFLSSRKEEDVVTAENFAQLGAHLLRRKTESSSLTFGRRYRACFGTSPKVCCFLWTLIENQIPKNATPYHLLWSLMFLKIYSTENVLASIIGVDEKTFRKYSWPIIKLISDLKLACYYSTFLVRFIY